MAIIEIKNQKDVVRIRKIALEAQGLLKPQLFGKGLSGAKKMINHLGYVQIDTISVVERAHHHIFYSRVANFKAEMTNQMLVERDIFEYWSHAAAFIPIADFRFSLPYKHVIKSGQTHWYKNKDKKLMKELLDRIRSEGPLRSRDIKSSPKKGAGWWDWKPSKKALEQLYMEGDLMVSSREGFQKCYDLTERVLPSNIDLSMPTILEFANHMVDRQLQCHGLVSLKGFTYLRRNKELRETVKIIIEGKLEDGSLQPLKMENGEVYYIKSDALDSPQPRLDNRLTILSPFDNSVIQRERLRALFQYNYQIECYLPEVKRKFGYFCLPLLFRGSFIGRMDCKAHRKTKVFEIKFLHIEQIDLDQDRFIAAFILAINKFRDFQGCDTISITTTFPRNIKQKIRSKLNR